jgi:hypothetical protein
MDTPGITPLYSRTMKTAISIPDATFARVNATAERLGFSRSEFFVRAAERWIADLEDTQTTAAIDAVLSADEHDGAFVERAASVAAQHSDW